MSPGPGPPAFARDFVVFINNTAIPACCGGALSVCGVTFAAARARGLGHPAGTPERDIAPARPNGRYRLATGPRVPGDRPGRERPRALRERRESGERSGAAPGAGRGRAAGAAPRRREPGAGRAQALGTLRGARRRRGVSRCPAPRSPPRSGALPERAAGQAWGSPEPGSLSRHCSGCGAGRDLPAPGSCSDPTEGSPVPAGCVASEEDGCKQQGSPSLRVPRGCSPGLAVTGAAPAMSSALWSHLSQHQLGDGAGSDSLSLPTSPFSRESQVERAFLLAPGQRQAQPPALCVPHVWTRGSALGEMPG